MAFKYLELTGAKCFGFNQDKDRSWRRLAAAASESGWNERIRSKIEKDLGRNVDASFFRICSFDFDDVETGAKWRASFENDRGCWTLEIRGEGQPAALESDKEGFFSSDDFVEACRKAGDHIDRAYDAYEKIIKPRMDAGELLGVDTKKLDSIIDRAGNKGFMDKFRSGAYQGTPRPAQDTSGAGGEDGGDEG